MRITGLRKTTTGQNGVGAFILQCTKMDFHYCDWAGSSKGMNCSNTHTATVPSSKNSLPGFAKANPQIEITVSPRPAKHPVIIGHYINGREKAICVRNLEIGQILKKAELLRDASGEKLKRVKKPVKSINESVRGIWSPYHSGGIKV
ncbi:hypothetical protein H4I96_10554 [Botrytis cinerea]